MIDEPILRMLRGEGDESDWPSWDYHSRLGLKPWHPPLNEVFATGPNPPDSWPGGEQRWREVWEVLQRLHQEYLDLNRPD